MVLLQPKWPVAGSEAVGAMALVKVPPQAAGLVRPFAFVFVLPEDLAGHDAIFVGFGLGFVWPYFSRRWRGGMTFTGQRRQAKKWSHGVCDITEDLESPSVPLSCGSCGVCRCPCSELEAGQGTREVLQDEASVGSPS